MYYVKTDVRLTGCVIPAALDENSIDNVGVPPLGFTHPAIWYHDYNGGRFFYTVQGHGFNKLTDEAYNEYSIVGRIYYSAEFPAPTFPERPPLAFASSSSFAGGYSSQTNEPENATDGIKDTEWEPTQYSKLEWIYFDYFSSIEKSVNLFKKNQKQHFSPQWSQVLK